MRIKPVTFKFNKQTDDKVKYGFVAQDVQEVYPEFISQMDEDGEPYLSLGSTDFIPCLIKVAQEQQAEITDLKAQLASLKATVDALVASTGHLVT
jgi:hypothetical protein